MGSLILSDVAPLAPGDVVLNVYPVHRQLPGVAGIVLDTGEAYISVVWADGVEGFGSPMRTIQRRNPVVRVAVPEIRSDARVVLWPEKARIVRSVLRKAGIRTDRHGRDVSGGWAVDTTVAPDKYARAALLFRLEDQEKGKR